MNIGETDADGWTYVRFGDAAKAAQEGTHEVQGRNVGPCWIPIEKRGSFFGDDWQYRVREKARTITVTIPRPVFTFFRLEDDSLHLRYRSLGESTKADEAIREAMRQQP